jgi:hypothetical protein
MPTRSHIITCHSAGRREKGEGRREKGPGRRQKAEGRREKGDGRREKGALLLLEHIAVRSTTPPLLS